MFRRLALATLTACLASSALAAPVRIGFDLAQAAYTPTIGAIQEVTGQFGALGVLFQDLATPGHGAVVGNCGPGDGPVSLFGFGHDYAECGDTTPDLDISFVDPIDNSRASYTTAVSIHNFDGLVALTAYDRLGALLGSTSASSGILALTGIGRIARVTLRSLDQDPTTLDTLTFSPVFSASAVPEPQSWILMLAGFGVVGSALRRRDRHVVAG